MGSGVNSYPHGTQRKRAWGHSQRVSAIMYVDDTDLLHINMETEESIVNTHAALQSSIDNWSQLLIATGGSLKPEKCFFYLISYEWKRDGSWCYSHNEQRQDLGITVSLPNGNKANIEHLAVDTPHTTLGITTCPTASHSSTIYMIREKALKWDLEATNSLGWGQELSTLV